MSQKLLNAAERKIEVKRRYKDRNKSWRYGVLHDKANQFRPKSEFVELDSDQPSAIPMYNLVPSDSGTMSFSGANIRAKREKR